jgi:tetratricopeptide (TPR) repeat protein
MAEAHDLHGEIAREIDQVAHFGRASSVKLTVAEAAEAFESGDYEVAAAKLVEAKRDAPRSVVVRELLGLSNYHLGRFREAARELAAYRRLSGERDQDPPYADAERALGRPEKAVEILSDLDPAEVSEEIFTEALIVRAGALLDLGRAAEAVEVLRSGPVKPKQVLPTHLRLWYTLADALEQADKRREARAWWDSIYAEDPDFFDVASRRLGLKRR